VSDGAPREEIHERKARRVARRRDEARLFRARVTRGKVRLAVLRRHTHAFDLRALVREEHESSEREANRVRAAHDEVDVVVRPRRDARPALSARLLRHASITGSTTKKINQSVSLRAIVTRITQSFTIDRSIDRCETKKKTVSRSTRGDDVRSRSIDASTSYAPVKAGGRARRDGSSREHLSFFSVGGCVSCYAVRTSVVKGCATIHRDPLNSLVGRSMRSERTTTTTTTTSRDSTNHPYTRIQGRVSEDSARRERVRLYPSRVVKSLSIIYCVSVSCCKKSQYYYVPRVVKSLSIIMCLVL